MKVGAADTMKAIRFPQGSGGAVGSRGEGHLRGFRVTHAPVGVPAVK